MARIEMQALNALPLILGGAMPGHSASAGDVENAYAGSATNIPVRNAGCHDFCTACIGNYFSEKCSQSEDACEIPHCVGLKGKGNVGGTTEGN